MVKKGYKQTEVGVIPEDWEVVQLKYVSTGKFTYGVNAPAVEYMPPLPNYIRITDISDDGRFIRENRMSVICANPEQFTLKENDIVFARTGASTGKTYLYRREDGKLVYAGFLIRATINPYLANSKYVFAALHTKEYWNWVSTSSMRSGQPGINGNEYASYQIALPDLAEQAYIVEALEGTDKLIVLLEKQISKKKAIKQGTMQELLTGKRRLLGFSGEWQNFNLMKHSKIKARIGWQGLKKAEYLDNGYALLVTGTDFDDGKVRWDNCHYVTRSRYDQDQNIQIRNNDILITKDGSLGKVALVQELTKPATLNSGIFVIRPLQSIYDPVFVYHILTSFVFKNFLDKLSAGSTIIHLYQKDVDKFEFLLPPSIEEQKAIAAILSEMDDDIEVLEEKLAKYRQVKQGMMQQLLTGKIRLV